MPTHILTFRAKTPKILEETGLEILPLPQSDLENILEKNDSVITIGVAATTYIKDLKSRVPDLKDLHHLSVIQEDVSPETLENFLEKARELDKRKEIKITTEDLPDIQAAGVFFLQQEGNLHLTTTKNGKEIRISQSPEEENSETLQVTFEELFWVKVTMETLGVGQVLLSRTKEENDNQK